MSDEAISATLEISVVICAYTEDRWDELERSVASARNQTFAPREVIVVVDHNPTLLERARRKLSAATVVPNSQLPGLAGARNSGVVATASDVVAFLDDDAEADGEWLDELRRGYGQPQVLGVGGGIDASWRVSRPSWFPDEFNWVVGCTYRGMSTTPAKVRNLIGANMSMRRSVFDAVGGFRQELGRLEETDLCIRAQDEFPDAIWLHWPSARIRHSVTANRASWRFFRARCYNEGVAKATMVKLSGRRAGLASERHYVRRVLPSGVARELGRIVHGDFGGSARAAAIVVGLVYTIAGYVRGGLSLRLRRGSDVHIPRRGAKP